MKLRDFGEDQNRSWFQQILEWSRKKISVEDNIDCVILSVSIGTSETIVDHPLGRIPKGIINVLSYPNNTSEMTWTRAPEQSRLFIQARTAGTYTLLLF